MYFRNRPLAAFNVCLEDCNQSSRHPDEDAMSDRKLYWLAFWLIAGLIVLAIALKLPAFFDYLRNPASCPFGFC